MMPHILLVDDEPAIVDNVTFALDQAGFEVTTSGLGSEALAILRGGAIDLVILDIGLPDIQGIDVCRTLRTFSDIPVVFLTARSAEIDRVVGLELGADDYVVKPFSPRELVARIRAILRRVSPDLPTDKAGLLVDEDRKTVSFGGRTLTLTRYEFAILARLLRRPGFVYSRDQLLQDLWDDPWNAEARVIDTHIKTIRAKLDGVGVKDVIRTHRGLGYSATSTPA